MWISRLPPLWRIAMSMRPSIGGSRRIVAWSMLRPSWSCRRSPSASCRFWRHAVGGPASTRLSALRALAGGVLAAFTPAPAETGAASALASAAASPTASPAALPDTGAAAGMAFGCAVTGWAAPGPGPAAAAAGTLAARTEDGWIDARTAPASLNTLAAAGTARAPVTWVTAPGALATGPPAASSEDAAAASPATPGFATCIASIMAGSAAGASIGAIAPSRMSGTTSSCTGAWSSPALAAGAATSSCCGMVTVTSGSARSSAIQ